MQFVVTDKPAWYSDEQKDSRAFTCADTVGLFDQVAEAMTVKESMLSEKCKAFQHKTTRKIVRDMVIEDIGRFKQNPSKSLLTALMDIMDLRADGLECMSTEDRAGMKQLMLALKNYTLFYIPTTALKSAAEDRVVIPVVTMWSHMDKELELRFCDKPRSMLGTYTVNLMSGSAAYFMQQVLIVPGVQSLNLLKAITGDKYEFWDMSLEVPTHPDALTPSFKQIQPMQLLRGGEDKDRTPATQTCGASGDGGADVEPMCCVLDAESADLQASRRQGSVDCFSDEDVICDLSRFTCHAGVAKTVYSRRTGRMCGRKRGNMTAVVSLRDQQKDKRTLYISTTARFCRALKCSCVKGSGELLQCCYTLLNELSGRETFLTGPELHQEITNPALTAFLKRVSPPASNWCNYTPKHVACAIEDPIMSEIVDLGIKLMDDRVPNAFAVAELLLCNTQKANQYVRAYECYNEDGAYRAQIHRNNIALLQKQFKDDWSALASIDRRIRASNSGVINKAQRHATRDLFRNLGTHNINDTFRQWQQLIKDTPAAKDSARARDYSNMKVLFHNLRVYHNKMNKLKKSTKTADGNDDDNDSNTPPDHGYSNRGYSKAANVSVRSASPRSEKAPVSPSQKPWCFSMIVPDNPPLGTWVKNIGTLLQSAPWLYADNTRREAVCSLLGLEKTLLHEKYSSVLEQWVSSNPIVVEQLKAHGLQDKLSLALIDRLGCMSTKSWIRKIKRAFASTPATKTTISSDGENDGKTTLDLDKRKKIRSNKTSRSNAARDLLYQEAMSCEDDTDDAEESGQDEEGEYDCTAAQGEDLLATEEYDNNELSGRYDDEKHLDEYDLEDDFIDDRSEDDYSIVESHSDACEPVKRTAFGRIDRRHHVDYSDTESDHDIPEHSGAHKGVIFSSDSEEEPAPARIAKRRPCVIKQHDDEDDTDGDDQPTTSAKLTRKSPTKSPTKSPRKTKESRIDRVSRKTTTSRRKQHKGDRAKGPPAPSCSSDFDVNKTTKQTSNKRRRGSSVRHIPGKRRRKSPSFRSDSDSDASNPESKCASPKIKRPRLSSSTDDGSSACESPEIQRRGTSAPTEDESIDHAVDAHRPVEENPVAPVESDGDLEDSMDFSGHIVAM
ncbi:pentatricopeptide repeat domain-containing protein 2 [Sarotherodon galilaeus]